MCHELMYSRRMATRESRKTEPEKVADAPPQIKAEDRKVKVPEPA